MLPRFRLPRRSAESGRHGLALPARGASAAVCQALTRLHKQLTRCPREMRVWPRRGEAARRSPGSQQPLRLSGSSAAQLPPRPGVPCRPRGAPCAPPRVRSRCERAALRQLLHRGGVREPVQRRHDERAHQVHLRTQEGGSTSDAMRLLAIAAPREAVRAAAHLHGGHVVQPDVGGAGTLQPPQAALDLVEPHAACGVQSQSVRRKPRQALRTDGFAPPPPPGRVGAACRA